MLCLGSPNLAQEEYRKRKVRQEIIGSNFWEPDNISGQCQPLNRCKHSARWDAAEEAVPETVTMVTVLPPFTFPHWSKFAALKTELCMLLDCMTFSSGGLYGARLTPKGMMRSESHSVLSNSVTPWTVACQTPLSVEFSRPKYWSG